MTYTIAVVGPGLSATHHDRDSAFEVGRRVAMAGHVLISGGLGGVMEAASRGAASAKGVVVGLLPGFDRSDANPFVSLAIPTGLGEMRNALLVRCADAVICIGGSWGTLSEVALAMRTGVPVVMLGGWDLPPGPVLATSAEQAVDLAFAAVG